MDNPNQPSQAKKISQTDHHLATKEVIDQYSVVSEHTLKPAFQKARLPYLPKQVVLLGLKQEKKLELWAKTEKHPWTHIKTYRLTAISGRLGPKLREHDKQIPEGIYHIDYLNPFSAFHLSLKLNYPNPLDRHFGRLEGRTRLGGDIFIHGKALSVGCLSVGDKAIEELFVLIGKIGQRNTLVIIAPYDMRKHQKKKPRRDKNIAWLPHLDATLAQAMTQFRMA